MDGAPEVEEDRHHHQHAGNGDHRVAEQGHAAQFGVEGFAAGGAVDDPFGQHVIHERREEEGAAEQVGRTQQPRFEVFDLAVLLELFVDLVHVEHFGVVQQGANQRVAGARRGQHGDADDAGNRCFLDGEPLGIELKQPDAASQQHADQAEQGYPVELAVFGQLPQPPAQRKGQGKQQCTVCAEAVFTTEHGNINIFVITLLRY